MNRLASPTWRCGNCWPSPERNHSAFSGLRDDTDGWKGAVLLDEVEAVPHHPYLRDVETEVGDIEIYFSSLPHPQDRYDRGVKRITVDLAKDWLSVADICEYMNVSPYVVTRMLRAEELTAVKMGREWRIARGDFEDWLNAQRLASSLRQGLDTG